MGCVEKTFEQRKLEETEMLTKLADRAGVTMLQARRVLVELFGLDEAETAALLVDAKQECIRRLAERRRRGE